MPKTDSFKEIVLDYYNFIDKKKIDKLLSLFSDDVLYIRCGLKLIGMKEFEEFYKKGRSINGKHTIKNLIVNKKEIIVEGNFTGKWKDGTPIKINFADFFFFNNKGKICERHTYTDQGKV